ncbi:MAG TPA: hypothetical protein VE093_31255 [Polyangiaceae bacterium]|nr:hypothetical protein [Polyangiaceae bacterium]
MHLDLEAYARIMAELAAAGDGRAAVLARHGLDEETWDTIDVRFQERLSEALDEEGDGLPALITSYTAAYEAAQRALAPLISLEQFASVTRLLQTTGDLRAALAKVGVTMAAYVHGAEHWTRRIAESPELERRFGATLRGGSADKVR